MLPLLPTNVLTVNLTTGDIRTEKFGDAELYKKTLGGRGLGTYLFLDRYDQKLDPLDEKLPIIFAAGSLTGTQVPCCGRTSIIFKSPVTKRFFKTNVGGHLGAQMKFAGYDIIIVEGKSERPAYILIRDDEVSIHDADHIWGKDTRETNDILRNEYNDEELQLACIGPAGENRVMFASINSSIYNTGGRGGGGALMGDKNLKAIAIRGSKYVKVADPKRFSDAVSVITKKMRESEGVKNLSDFGTSIGVASTNSVGAFPVRNFQESSIKNVHYLTGQYLVESGILKNKIGCYSCPVGCHRYSRLDSGRYKGTFCGGPEYETVNALGAGCGTVDIEAVLKANEYCNILGMDVISTGGVIQWLMECKQHNLIDDEIAGGLDLDWGSSDTVVELTRMIAYRIGVGNMLANGVKAAAEEMGQGSDDWAVEAKGLEQSRVETRSCFAYALAFAINSRGPDHLNTECLAEFGGDQAAIDLIERITGDKKYAFPHTTEKRPEIVRWHEDIYAAGDSFGLCAFPTTAQFWVDEFNMAELFSASTGLEITSDELMEAGRRTILMERLATCSAGYTREHDVLPKRLMNEKQVGAMHDGAINNAQMLEPMKDIYYALHGWDVKTGMPTAQVVKQSGLGELLPTIQKYVKLP